MSVKVSSFNTFTLMTLTVYSLTVRGAQWITAYPQENLFVLISNSAEGVYIQMLMPGDERKVYDVGKMFNHELLHLRSSMQWNMLAWRWSVDRVVQCFKEKRGSCCKAKAAKIIFSHPCIHFHLLILLRVMVGHACMHATPSITGREAGQVAVTFTRFMTKKFKK